MSNLPTSPKHSFKHGLIKRLRIVACLLPLYLIASDETLTVRHYHIHGHDFPSLAMDKPRLRLLLISDLHSCFYGDGQHELMAPIMVTDPDVILLGGDIYDDKLPQKNTDVFLDALKDTRAMTLGQVYYVTGNHELWADPDDYAQMIHKLKARGIHILAGDSVQLPNSNIHLHGISDPDSGSAFAELAKIGAQARADNFNILLAHRPEHIDAYRNHPFHLVTSGHAHGGQWRLPPIINGVLAPAQGLFPKYAGGEFHFSGDKPTRLIVSRGLAKESTRYIPRIFNRPEVVVIDIHGG